MRICVLASLPCTSEEVRGREVVGVIQQHPALLRWRRLPGRPKLRDGRIDAPISLDRRLTLRPPSRKQPAVDDQSPGYFPTTRTAAFDTVEQLPMNF